MKYSTYVTYGIKPEVLELIPYKKALQLCKEGAIKRVAHLTHNSCPQNKWCSRRKVLIEYIRCSIEWCDAKLDEFPKHKE